MNNTTSTTSVSEIIKYTLEQKQLNNPKFSLRSFAKKLNISAGTLSEVINEKRILSPARAESLAEALFDSQAEIENFNAIARREYAKSEGRSTISTIINRKSNTSLKKIKLEDLNKDEMFTHLDLYVYICERTKGISIESLKERFLLNDIEEGLNFLIDNQFVMFKNDLIYPNLDDEKNSYIMSCKETSKNSFNDEQVDYFVSTFKNIMDNFKRNDLPKKSRLYTRTVLKVNPEELPNICEAIKGFFRELEVSYSSEKEGAVELDIISAYSSSAN